MEAALDVNVTLCRHTLEKKRVEAIFKKKGKKSGMQPLFFHSSVFLKAPWPIFYPRRQHSLSRKGHQTCRLPKQPILDGVLDCSPQLLSPPSPLPLSSPLPPADPINHPMSL